MGQRIIRPTITIAIVGLQSPVNNKIINFMIRLPTLCLVLIAVILTAGCNLVMDEPGPSLPPLPTVQFLDPQADAVVSEGDEVTIRLLAQDPGGTGVARVALLIDDLPHQEALPVVSAAVPVFTVDMNWLASGIGLHALTATAFRLDGTAGPPTTIRILVGPRDLSTPTPPPQVG